MKKTLALILALAMLATVFAGCAPKEEEKTPDSVEPSATPEVPADNNALTENELIARMEEIAADPEHPLAAAAIGVIKDGKVIFANTIGNKQIDNENPANNIAANADTKYRIASISKLCAAIGAWQLIEQGLIDPEADISDYLGFEVRNPNFPDTAITVKMLMSHTSSIREGGDNSGNYNIPYGHDISEFFQEGAEYYCDGCWAPAEEAPGEYFSYCNMNYCLLATIMEKVSGERFDQKLRT